MFVGRHQESSDLFSILERSKASLVVIHGRRRVGKTALIESTFKKQKLLKIEGIEQGNKKIQIQTTLSKLSSYFKDPSITRLKLSRWLEVFELIAKLTRRGSHIVYLEELQWLANYESELVGDLKYAWDNLFSRNPKLVVILCGSSPSFMVNKVLNSKALYGRTSLEINLQPFSFAETKEFLGKKFTTQACMDAYLSLGGIPEYLSFLESDPSIYLSICKHSFRKECYFLSEYQRVFISSLANNPNYQNIIELLAREKFLTRDQIIKSLDLETGGTTSNLLQDLEVCSFIHSYSPFGKGTDSKLKRYEISDGYLQFYFKFIKPKLNAIRNGKYSKSQTQALNLTQYQQWLGYGFERWCRANHAILAKVLGFSDIEYEVGPYFSRGTASNFQIDLIFSRADRVKTVCEIKYTRAPVSRSVIKELEDKLEKLPLKKNETIQRILISASGADSSVRVSGFFDKILSLEELSGVN